MPPNLIKMHPKRRNKRRYYHFHREHEHDDEEFHDLKNQIEDLIRQGHPSRYVCDQQPAYDGRHARDSSPHSKGPIEKQINVIVGTSRGDTSSACKAYARAEVEKRPRCDRDPEITFKPGEEGYLEHDDALVISHES
ncbi:hypothetical protein BHM03_00008106 [Ensete ventricosum]|nr:hypothetical protein BHM03_00008106 [Ensete ventricosum]